MQTLRQYRYFPIFLFLALYGLFYGFNMAYTGLTVPGGYYVPFLDEHLNYVRGFRNFLLEGSAALIRLTGRQTFLYDHGIKLESGSGVRLVYSCLGFSIFSFWWAMILAFPQSARNKLRYLLAGTGIIIVLNLLRIAAVALVYDLRLSAEIRQLDHHMVFNLIVYGVLILMLLRWFNLEQPVINIGTREHV